MDIVKAFATDEETAVINVQGTCDDPLFQANQIGKLLGIIKIHNTIVDFDEDEKVTHSMGTLGGVQNVTFLTELGLYRLLGMSRKPLARKFQKWVASVIKEIRIHGKYEADQNMKQQIEENNKACTQSIEKTRHNTLIESHHHKNGVYLGRVLIIDDIGGIYIVIKIGNTNEINQRATDLKLLFGEFLLLEFFPCHRHIAIERSIFDHETIKKYAYTEPINGHVSTETIIIPKDMYSDILSIVTHKVKQNSDGTLYQLELAEKQQKILDTQLEIANKNIEILRLHEHLPPQVIYENVVTIQEVVEPMHFAINENRQNSRGYKIQKYLPSGELVETYSGTRDVTRKVPGTSDNGLKAAIKNNTIYKEHRWLFLDRNGDDNTVQEIGENIVVRQQHTGLVAMLSIDKSHIVQVFQDQRSAAADRQFTSTGSISQAIKLSRRCSGHYFCYYNDCSEDLKNAYLEHSNLPGQPPRCNAKQIKQLHPITRSLIKTYNCIADVQKDFQASRTTLKKVIDENAIFKGYIWSW